jgi:drug/metabolite transporter (DMT)-like permease
LTGTCTPHALAAGMRSRRWLLVSLVMIWAVTFPVIKVGVIAVPPLWYNAVRYLIATLCLFVVVGLRRRLVVPSRADWRVVAVSGVFQMAVFSALAGVALTRLPPGRAAFLCYSTPLWVVPLAAWYLREPASRRAIAGLVVGLLGMAVIVAPTFQPRAGGEVLPYAMLMTAAAAWALSIVFVRAHRFEASTLALAPWQTLLAGVLLSGLAAAIEGTPPAIGKRGLLSLAYVSPVATAFAYWALVEVGRQFQARTIAIALQAVPALGLLLSTLALGETVDVSLGIGVLLIAGGIRLATTG